MITRFRTRAMFMALLSMTIVTSACDKKEDDDEKEEEDGGGVGGGGSGGSEDDTLTLSGTLAIGSTTAALSLAPALADLVLYCVSFEATPRSGTSDFGADGAFSVVMPVSVNFGCFVNNRADNSVVGTFVIESGDEGGLGAGNTTSLALSGSLDLGALTLGEDGRVIIPAAALESAKYVPAEGEGLVLDEMHNAEYDMTCVDTGNAQALADCQDQLMDQNDTTTVFFRVLKATEGGVALEGLGVWKDKASFDACGGFDFTEEDVAREDGTVTEFSQGSIGTFAGADCAKRDDSDSLNNRNIQNYYAVSKVVKNGAGYSFRTDDDHFEDNGGGCSVSHTTGIEFSGTSAEIYGAFANSEVRKGCNGIEVENKSSAFNVKFVKK